MGFPVNDLHFVTGRQACLLLVLGWVRQGRAWWDYQLPATFPPDAADLVRKALQPRRSRIDAAEVERHEWMRQPEADMQADTEESDA